MRRGPSYLAVIGVAFGAAFMAPGSKADTPTKTDFLSMLVSIMRHGDLSDSGYTGSVLGAAFSPRIRSRAGASCGANAGASSAPQTSASYDYAPAPAWYHTNVGLFPPGVTSFHYGVTVGEACVPALFEYSYSYQIIFNKVSDLFCLSPNDIATAFPDGFAEPSRYLVYEPGRAGSMISFQFEFGAKQANPSRCLQAILINQALFLNQRVAAIDEAD